MVADPEPKSPVALVTGGGRGIGRGIALELARGGADVVVTYRAQRAPALEVVDKIRNMGRRSLALRADVRKPSIGASLIQRIVSDLDRLDILVSNAGCVVSSSFLDTAPAEYDLQQNTNTRGSFFIAQAAARQMIAQGDGGNIVFITSRAGHRALHSFSAYCISKAGQRMLTEVLAIELAPFQIRVNAVAPGTTETELNRDLLRDPDRRSALLGKILLGRPGTPADIAHTVRFLVSDDATFLTGCTVPVDGGAVIN